MTTKTNPGNYFEDFEIGQTLEHSVPRTVTEGDNALYVGLTADRFPIYCNAEFARKLGYRRELINDLLTFHIVFGKSVPDISLNARANLGYADVRFMRPVYPGDTLSSISKVLGKKENRDGQTGIVWVRTQGFNQRDEVVLRFYRWVMVKKKDPDTKTGENNVPNLPAEVAAADLPVDAELDLKGFDRRVTGGRWFLGDYAKGERIFHDAGMTIEEADHTTATRLYQNTAKVHFDLCMMSKTPGGRRLMYGGHVISVVRALSFNGLENALRIAAWNGGTHANPTFAGDTLYGMTDVIDTMEIPGRSDVGALRLRLCAVKNQDPEREPVEIKTKNEETGREAYNPNVVLDLDYTVIVPKG